MNYIKQLEQERNSLATKLGITLLELNHFKAFLQTSTKFQSDPNGERKDWIATGDVIIRLQEIMNQI